MNKAQYNLALLAFAFATPLSSQEQQKTIDYDMSGIAVTYDTTSYGDYFYELENRDGCSVNIRVSKEKMDLGVSLDSLRNTASINFRRGKNSLLDLAKDTSFLSNVSNFSYWCPNADIEDSYVGFSIYPQAIYRGYPNGDTAFIKYENEIRPAAVSLTLREIFDNERNPKDTIFGLLGAPRIEFKGCISGFYNGEQQEIACKPR